MHPTAARSNRSPLQSSIPSASTPPSVVHPTQQQILYGPVANPMVTLQPCGTGLHPSCIYPGARNAGLSNPIPLHMQGKGNRWPSKSKVLRGQQQYCQQQQIQQQLSYNPKPLVLYDQSASNPAPPPPTTSFLVASSTFAHGSFSGDQYNPGVTLIPQPYFKPPDVQTFCLLQDRPTGQPDQQHGSYYNISATNTCSLQAVNGNPGFQFPSLAPYAGFSNQIPGSVQSGQIFPNPPVNLVFGPRREKPHSTLDVSGFKVRPKPAAPPAPLASANLSESCEWPQTISFSNNLFDTKSTAGTNREAESARKVVSNASAKTQEEHYSDESSASFDFTIEAEKMVSALCNTSPNDLGKEEAETGKTAPLFSGAGDTGSKNSWFADFCTDFGTGASVATQTDSPSLDRSQYPEMLRKVAYWGCTEAEALLTGSKSNAKCNWLKNLSSATKTAITKSSTCFPIFAGDRVLVGDLINALIRVTNGWLILDNYLNKQHYPALGEKLDHELFRCFRTWEESTYELLDQLVQAFLKLDEEGTSNPNDQKANETSGASFPGDVSLYASCDLFDPSGQKNNGKSQDSKSNREAQSRLPAGSLRVFNSFDAGPTKHRESKLRSKWTVTENQSTVDSTKPAADLFVGHADVDGKYRGKAGPTTTSSRVDASTRSLTAEFFHRWNKVLETGNEPSRQWKKQDFDGKVPFPETVDAVFRLQRADASCENAFNRKCLPKLEPFANPQVNLDSVYIANNEALEVNYACTPYSVLDYNANKGFKNPEQNRGAKGLTVDPVYVGKSSTSQMELAAVPKNRMTLLSQIEPSVPDKASVEMTANLSAWFASMRNSEGSRMNQESRILENIPRLPRPELSKSAIDLTRQLQMDGNRQLQTLQNMQSIQSAPWNACNLIANRVQVHHVLDEYDSSEDVRVYMKPGSYNVPKKRHQRRCNRRMDGGSLQRNATVLSRGNYSQKEKGFGALASSTPSAAPNVAMKLPFPATPIPSRSPCFSLESSPRILRRADAAQDVTWKAACASAEILLEALNVKEDADPISCKEVHRNVEEVNAGRNNSSEAVLLQFAQNEKSQESLSKVLKRGNEGGDGASSYEASEDDSGSTYHLSPKASVNDVSRSSESKNGFNKTNVKTDSWLIRTLNNASMSKQKRRKTNADEASSESSNTSVVEEEAFRVNPAENAATNASSTPIESLQPISRSRENPASRTDHILTETERVAGKATYSETVRRCMPPSSEKKDPCRKSKLNAASAPICSTVIPIPGRRCQRKDPERSYHLLHKSRKSCAKRSAKNCEINEPIEEATSGRTRILRNETAKENSSSCATSKTAIATRHRKKKDGGGFGELVDGKWAGKSGDRGWSVWYSSERKPSLSPLALSKLETIHRTLWQMKEAEIFKCPSSATIEDYCKVIKSPMFLETVDYKLKNRVYHKVEYAVRDYRRIVYNSKLYHKNDHDRLKTIDALSRKVEELFQEHFASWDFDNVTGSPRESSPISHRQKSTGQKPVAGRYGNAKKSPTSEVVAENV